MRQKDGERSSAYRGAICAGYGLLSRLPIFKAKTRIRRAYKDRSGRYFSMVGLLLGVLCGGLFLLLDAVLPSTVPSF
ncbi:hypothetical protein O9992_17765 [Vibrio lentus]|nr:hypothetical protein [Vibrio lentus]